MENLKAPDSISEMFLLRLPKQSVHFYSDQETIAIWSFHFFSIMRILVNEDMKVR